MKSNSEDENPELSITIFTKTLSSTNVSNIDNNNNNVSWAANQHVKMISEGLCDTYVWSNRCWKISFASQEYIFKYIFF